jgi:hypothetical protein
MRDEFASAYLKSCFLLVLEHEQRKLDSSSFHLVRSQEQGKRDER